MVDKVKVESVVSSVLEVEVEELVELVVTLDTVDGSVSGAIVV